MHEDVLRCYWRDGLPDRQHVRVCRWPLREPVPVPMDDGETVRCRSKLQVEREQLDLQAKLRSSQQPDNVAERAQDRLPGRHDMHVGHEQQHVYFQLPERMDGSDALRCGSILHVGRLGYDVPIYMRQ